MGPTRPDPMAFGAAGQARELLVAAVRALLEARGEVRAEDRYARAHLAALRTAAALLATRARPAPRRGGGPRSAWLLLTEVAPELGEWAAYFQAGAGKRGAAEAGVLGAVSEREADDLVRGVESFLDLVAGRLGLPGPGLLGPLGMAV